MAELNQARYFLSWLYWEKEDYYRAAVMGEFLARHYPDHPAGAAAARIAMASFERLEAEGLSSGQERGSGDFAARHAADVAQFITRRWPDSREAEAAVTVLVHSAIRSDRIDDARRLLANVPAEARPQLELQLGAAMWARYSELLQRDVSDRPSDAALREMKDTATEYLVHSIDAVRAAGRADESTAIGSIYLAQALLAQSDFGGAIKALEDETTGPITLIAHGDGAVARPGLAIQIYETALRVYVAATPPRTQKVLETMQQLEKAIEERGGSLDDQLTRVYVSLGLQLQQQIDQLRAAGRAEDADRVAAAFAEFVDRIVSRKEGLNWNTRLWLAQSYYRLGAGPNDSVDAPHATEAQMKRLTKSRDLYQSLLSSATSATPPPSEAAVIAARFQLGECLREMGKYGEALDTFSAVLEDRESTLAVQRAAALAYQQRGQVEGGEWFERAIFGGYKLKTSGENRVWGWLKISQVADRAARSDSKFRDSFFDARVNIARCRYLAALQQQGDARQESLSQAKQNIQSVALAYPDLGGPRWQAEFDALSKQVEAAEAERPIATQQQK